METPPKISCEDNWMIELDSEVACGHFLVESESRRKLNGLRLDALSIPHYVIKKVRPHGVRHGKTEEQKELTLKNNITKEFTIVFEETQSIVNRNSNLAGPSRSASRWTSWHKKIARTVNPKRNSIDTKDSGISHSDFDQTSEVQSQSKTVSIKNQAKKSYNPFLLNNIGDGTLPRAIPGGTGTRPEAGGAHERTIQFIFCLLQ